MAFERVEPFGDRQADLRAGMTAAAAANFGFTRPSWPLKPDDLFPSLREPPRRKTPQELRDAIDRTMRRVGAAIDAKAK